MIKKNGEVLDDKEMDRVDLILSSAKRLHYINFIICGFSLAILSLEDITELLLPIGGITLPYIQTSVGIYIVSLALTFSSFRLFRMANRWLKYDPRRTLYPWIALGVDKVQYWMVFMWIIFPFVINTLPLVTVKEGYNAFSLFLPAFIMLTTPDFISNKINQLKSRLDDYENNMSLSIWILYWIRLLRAISLVIIFSAPIFNVIPAWEQVLLPIQMIGMAMLLVLGLIRMIGGFVYKWIDRIGQKIGFQ